MKKLIILFILITSLYIVSPIAARAYAITGSESAVVNIIEKADPSVVTIVIEKKDNQLPQKSSLINYLFRTLYNFTNFHKTQSSPQSGTWDIGTGFIISKDGLIITAKHVVKDTRADYFAVVKNKGKFKVVNSYKDPKNEVAILKVDAHDLKAVDLGDSDKVKVGQMAIAIGTALGELRDSVTIGIISGLNREIEVGDNLSSQKEKIGNLLQTDAAINFGNSGGPLFDSDGKVIGINVVAGEGENIGFAIPINIAKKTIQDFQKNNP